MELARRRVPRTPAPVLVSSETTSQLGIRYRMRERLLAFDDDFYIETETDQRAFWIDGKALQLRDTLLFKDLQGNEIYRIQATPARIRDTMTIYRGDEVVAIVKKALITPARILYSVSVAGLPDLSTHGNVSRHEYSIKCYGTPVARISKCWFRIRGTYGVEVAHGQHDLLILVITVCIDAMSQST